MEIGFGKIYNMMICLPSISRTANMFQKREICVAVNLNQFIVE